MTDSNKLLSAYENLNWENFVLVSDALTSINEGSLDEELTHEANRYAHWAGLLGKAKADLELVDSQLKNYEAVQRKSIRDTVPGKLTVQAVNDLVCADEVWMKLSGKIANANEKFLMLKGLIRSLEIKHDNLVQLSAHKRAETNLYNKL